MPLFWADSIEQKLSDFTSISLAQMKEVKLMDRIDTKFVAPAELMLPLLERFRDNYMAQQHDGKMVAGYQTTYFDTEKAIMYLNHHNGKLCRVKIRVREYLDTNDSFLEIKNKSNKARTKKVRVPSKGSVMECLGANEEFIERESGFGRGEVSPLLESIFSRITFVNCALTERITIDFGLRFRNIRNGAECSMGEIVIIELKQQGHSVSQTKDILRELRIKPIGFSKYCVGYALTEEQAKQNRLKPKLRYIEKLVAGVGIL